MNRISVWLLKIFRTRSPAHLDDGAGTQINELWRLIVASNVWGQQRLRSVTKHYSAAIQCILIDRLRRTLRYSLHLIPALSVKFWALQISPKRKKANILFILTSRAFQKCIEHRVKEMPWLINLNNIAEKCLKTDKISCTQNQF